MNRKFLLRGLDDIHSEVFEHFWKRREEGKTGLIYLGISLTSRCNLNCVYCYSLHPKKNQLSLGEYKSLIAQAKELGAETVIICGDGEPTIDPFLLPIIQFSFEMEMNNVLVSNGLIFGDDDLCKDIHGCSAIDNG